MAILKNGDYLVEVTMCLAVRRKVAPAVIALTRSWDHDDSEEEKVLSAVMDLADEGYARHEPPRLKHQGSPYRF